MTGDKHYWRAAPDEPTRNRILVQNAAELYGFGKAAQTVTSPRRSRS